MGSATALCPIVASPRLSLTKYCPPKPVAPGELLVYSGSVSNSGNITITNVTVVNDRPAPNTPVLGPVNLAPGQVANFSGSYPMPYDCCGPCVDTLTARGKESCNGSNVVATASDACPRITTPKISVTRDCPPTPVNLGDLVFFTGVVSNAGNSTLANVVVVDDQAGVVVDSLALAPGEAVLYWGLYFATDCGPQVASGVTATANDVCTGVAVNDRYVTTCGVLCPPMQPVTLIDVKVEQGVFKFSFDTETNRNYTVQFTDELVPPTWQDLTNIPGQDAFVTIPVSITTTQRFFRVVTQ